MCNLHWCYTFCTGVTLFALVLHLNCTALSKSESSNFFKYIINLGHIDGMSNYKLQAVFFFSDPQGKCKSSKQQVDHKDC